MKLNFEDAIFLLLPTMAFAAIGPDGYCRSDNCNGETGECIFSVKLNLTAGELGYYTFKECGEDVTNPTLGIEMGKTYRFVQADRSNWYHPLGFAYYADGAHNDVDELEPGIAPPGVSAVSGSVSKTLNTTCAKDLSCPAPMYFQNGTYLGKYSNDRSIMNVTTGEDDFGLDHYEPLFFHPPPQWTEYGEFSVTLLFPEIAGFQGDIFYFCHIHQYMTGRIKLLKDDVSIQPDVDTPKIPYDYDTPSDYDQTCGTYGLKDFQLAHPECPERFVCNVPNENKELAAFSDCIDSMNCHMFAGMTTNVNAGSENALFIHQMIPHHQNAVNMAKALLVTGKLKCKDLTEETDDCVLENILREIINVQNAQIQAMRGILDNQFPKYPTDDCKVEIPKVNNKYNNSGVGINVVSGAGTNKIPKADSNDIKVYNGDNKDMKSGVGTNVVGLAGLLIGAAGVLAAL